MSTEQDTSKRSRVEIILDQIDALPTLPPVASRLLQISSSADADFRQIISLIESDPVLTAKLLGLCNKPSAAGVDEISTVERAVVRLGFDAVRSAVISIAAFDALANRPGEDDDEPLPEGRVFDRVAFWRHSIAVGSAAELIADAHKGRTGTPPPPEAFVCGLLHGIGILALEYALPKTFVRVLDVADRTLRDLAEVERQVMGLDHHTAGRRLAERWALPKPLHDVIWLHGMPYSSLPEVPHRPIIGLVNAAIALARSLHVGWSGDPRSLGDPSALLEECGMRRDCLDGIMMKLHSAVSARSATLGLEEPSSEALLLDSLSQANRQLERLRRASGAAEEARDRHLWAIGVLGEFQQTILPTRTTPDLAADVARCASKLLGDGLFALILRRQSERTALALRLAGDGRILQSKSVDAPSFGEDQNQQRNAWLASLVDVRAAKGPLRAMPLPAPGIDGVLLHDRDVDAANLPKPLVRMFASAWAAALANSLERERLESVSAEFGALRRRHHESLAQVSAADGLRKLADLAAGAAEEMHKPLAVISGRCDLLVEALDKQRDQRSLEAIRLAAERVGSLLSALRLFAITPASNPAAVDVGWMLGRAVREARQRFRPDPRRYPQPKVKLVVEGAPPRVHIDGEQAIEALTEVILNGLEAQKSETVEVRVQQPTDDGRLVVLIMDDGQGIGEEAIAHVFEPFFTERTGARRQGLGLAKARRLLGLNGADIALQSKPGEGVVAAISMPVASADAVEAPTEEPDQQQAA